MLEQVPVGCGRVDIALDSTEGAAALTVNEFETLRRGHPKVTAGLLEGISRELSDRIRNCSAATFEKDAEGRMALTLNSQRVVDVRKEIRPVWARPALWAMVTLVVAAVATWVGT